MKFTINPRLLKSGICLTEISGCHVLLKNDSNFSWLIVVPEVDAEIEDLHQLPTARFDEVMKLVRLLSQFVEITYQPEKLNVGCIGNQVRQMHIHIIGRTKDDPAWPDVVWGAKVDKQPYPDQEVIRLKSLLEDFLAGEM